MESSSTKMSFLGIGPRIGLTALPLFAVAVTLSLIFKDRFRITGSPGKISVIAGSVIIAVGLLLYFLTVPSLLKGVRENKLVTTGTFYLCCNPLYASILIFVIPGTAILMNSWIILAASVAGYISFKTGIGKEYSEMEILFADDYKRYRKITPEIIPFPVKKFFKCK